ncbi:putative signal peptidase complex subunit 2 [Psilocybe cubensis]|uniref:Signal peptidase complex subunit 2 n=2 Tax=Psilocybe cubensis TaxID=181762 RepID=A0ACB8GT57_PSICU|nr:putative signal peptidase complex subunit 2 [Psilocybe cubensis]KAH9478607.1 putative signal peptidase complex subunit 2 [Psilocybe cubensis]
MARSKKIPELTTTPTDTNNAQTLSPTSSRTRSPPSPESERPMGPLSAALPSSTRDVVKVNNGSATELKNACDDAVKRYLSRPELFRQDHRHTDVRLALGWLSVFVAAGTALYGYKIDFEKSKPVVTLGLILYIILTVGQTLYAYFFEGNTIFVGKRKSLSKRIISERIQLASSTIPPAKSSSSLSPSNSPSYQLAITYVRSTNKGKSLLAKGRTKGAQSYSSFFDDQGNMDQEGFERWVGELVEQAMDGKSA